MYGQTRMNWRNMWIALSHILICHSYGRTFFFHSLVTKLNEGTYGDSVCQTQSRRQATAWAVSKGWDSAITSPRGSSSCLRLFGSVCPVPRRESICSCRSARTNILSRDCRRWPSRVSSVDLRNPTRNFVRTLAH